MTQILMTYRLLSDRSPVRIGVGLLSDSAEVEADSARAPIDAGTSAGTSMQDRARAAGSRAAAPTLPPRELLGVACAALLALGGCAQTHGRIEDGPLYVHLCDAMPEDDQLAWGEAAGEINAELGEPVLWVGHGPPIGCNTVDVCPSSAVREGAETRIDECVITVRYSRGSASEVAAQELGKIVRELPPR